jgi:hypothetical protein
MSADGGPLARLRAVLSPLDGRWWTTLLVPYLVVGLQFVVIRVLSPAEFPSQGVYATVARVLAVFYFVTLAVALVGYTLDTRYVAEQSDWKPTLWYAAMFFLPVVGVIILLLYLFKRHRRVGL